MFHQHHQHQNHNRCRNQYLVKESYRLRVTIEIRQQHPVMNFYLGGISTTICGIAFSKKQYLLYRYDVIQI